MNLTLFNKHNRPSLFDEFLDTDFWKPLQFKTTSSSYLPSVNLSEVDNEIKVEMALPGFDKKDIKITLEDNNLTISNEVTDSKNETSDKYIHKEFNYSSFSRTFKLPSTVDIEKIESKMENGILIIKIPKSTSKATKCIDIQ